MNKLKSLKVTKSKDDKCGCQAGGGGVGYCLGGEAVGRVGARICCQGWLDD